MTKPWPVMIILVCFLALYACKVKKAVVHWPPACIQEKITSLNMQVYPGYPRIVQYQYNGKTVFYIPPFVPDGFSDLLDSNCTIICHPDGGITGKGDGQCSDFLSTRADEKIIWQKK